MLRPGQAGSGAARQQEDAVIALLGSHRVMRHLPREELHALIRQAAVQKYLERDMIFAQGDVGRTVMVVVEGYVKLSSSTFGGREVLLEVAGPGGVFGEVAVLNEWPRAADAAALSTCRLLAIEGGAFVRALQRTPAASFEIIRVLSERLRSTTEQMTDGLDMPAPARLAKALMRLSTIHSHPVKEGLRIDFQLSQRELGSMTGLTRESINKHLANWRDSGWVILSDRFVTVRDPRRLQELVRDHSAAAE